MIIRLLGYRVIEEGGRLREILYELEDEKWGRYYRVVKLLRLLRSPRELSQVETLLEICRDVVVSLKQFAGTRLILLTAHSRKIVLNWCYGVAI